MTRVEHKNYPGRVGTVWVPIEFTNVNVSHSAILLLTDVVDQVTPYEAAGALGLLSLAEPPPTELRGEYHMVAWDDRPGVLEVRYLDELTILPEPPAPPEPTGYDRLITKVEHAMWHALREAEDAKRMGAYIISDEGLIDGRDISLRPLAEAALVVFGKDLVLTLTRAINGVIE
jgi:hypothetical protein